MGWTCSACTYYNKNNGGKSCFTCGTERAKKLDNVVNLYEKNDDDERKLPANKKRASSTGTQQTLFGCGGVIANDSNNGKESKRAKTTATTAGCGGSSSSTSSKLFGSLPGESYNPIVNEPYEDRWKRCKVVMRDVFGVEKLRKQQPKAVECALKGSCQIVVMATGGGKSLCYQLPAVVLGGVTIVLSPLIALMKDQVENLLKKGVQAACINSSIAESVKTEIRARLLSRRISKPSMKSNEANALRPISILYVTPESLQAASFQSILKELHSKNRLALFAIDEAHCMSTWGHDFRPAYRKLNYISETFSDVPLMALTATATPKVINDIQQILKLEKAPLHVGSFDRPNVFYKVHYKDGLNAMNPGGGLADISKFITKQHKRAKKEGRPCSGIVYVHKREDTYLLASEIQKRTKVATSCYHGTMKAKERNQVQEDWTSGKIKIAVATTAFGMGIDLAHVRYVVHWSIPKTLDNFYQESGRAGRDGLPAISLVYFSRDEAQLFSFLIRKSAEDRMAKEGNKRGDGGADRGLQALNKVVDYCMTPHCRRAYVLQHFGEKETDPKTVCQKSCDYCSNPARIEKAIQSSDSCRLIAKQKKEAAKKSNNQWDGQWEKPHGEGDDWDEHGGDQWEVDGLGITSAAREPKKFVGSSQFSSAKSLNSKLKALEAMEMQENASETTGFVKFTTVKNKDTGDHFPEHFKEQLKKIALTANVTVAKAKPIERSSEEIGASADKLKAELAALEAKKKALLNRAGSTSTAAAPPPPPALTKMKSKSKF